VPQLGTEIILHLGAGYPALPDEFNSSRESQKQSRAVLEERLGTGAELGLSFLGGAIPSFFEHLLGIHGGSNGSTRAIEDSEARAVAELEERALGNGNDDLTK
jgi:hypothetical protein